MFSYWRDKRTGLCHISLAGTSWSPQYYEPITEDEYRRKGKALSERIGDDMMADKTSMDVHEHIEFDEPNRFIEVNATSYYTCIEGCDVYDEFGFCISTAELRALIDALTKALALREAGVKEGEDG